MGVFDRPNITLTYTNIFSISEEKIGIIVIISVKIIRMGRSSFSKNVRIILES